MQRLFRPVVLALALCAGASCYGSFAAVKKVYDLNGSFSDNKYLRTIIMYGLVIIPVYQIAFYADIIIFNTIEFWTEDNPLVSNEAPKQDTRLAQHDVETDGQNVTLRHGGVRYELRPVDGQRVALLADGKLVGVTVVKEDGALELYDATGALVRVIPAEQARALQAGVAPLVPLN